MRYFIIFFLLPFSVFAQSTFDIKTLNGAFLHDLNYYRSECGIGPLVLDTGLMPFMKEHCEFMANEVGVTHGEYTNYSFKNRWDTFTKTHREYRNIKYRGEILLSVFVPVNGTGDIQDEDGITKLILDGECSDSCLSLHMLDQWSHSPQHNYALLNGTFTHMYLYAYRKGHQIFAGVIFIDKFGI